LIAMASWTLVVIRHRKAIIAAWIALFIVGGAAAAHLGDLLSNRFSVPGSDAERGLTLLKDHMHERSDGAFTLVAQGQGGAPDRAAVAAAAQRAARAIEGGPRGAPSSEASATVSYVQISTPLENEDAAKETPSCARRIGSVPGATTYLTGYPALNHDTQPIYNKDLSKGESIAVPVAILVMAFMFGTRGGSSSRCCSRSSRSRSRSASCGSSPLHGHGDLRDEHRHADRLRDRDRLLDARRLPLPRGARAPRRPARGPGRDDEHGGRATLFSGLTVAVGLGLLVFMPVPFMRSMGVGGVLVPIVSIAASATFLPAFLAVMGRGVNRFRVDPAPVLERRAAQDVTGGWHRLAMAIMRRPVCGAASRRAVLIALALAATGLHLTGGDNRGLPITTEAARGLKISRTRSGRARSRRSRS
jgi:RND superfamily putative drug exporter